MEIIHILKDYWFLISGVLIPVITYLLGLYKADKKLKKALCSIQRNSLLKSCEDYQNRGWCSIQAKETLNELYKSYHELGGNSFITEMVNQVNELPIKQK